MPPQENQVEIDAVVALLNANVPPATWVPIQGFSAITNMVYNQGGGVTYTPTTGFPLKGFLNTTTGEVRIYTAERFIQIPS